MWILLGVLGVILLYGVYAYNRLVRTRNRVDNAWSQIDVQLRRRYDLIPNLVEAVKGYAAHEREVFEHVADARSQAQQASTVGDQAQALRARSAPGQAAGMDTVVLAARLERDATTAAAEADAAGVLATRARALRDAALDLAGEKP